MRLYGPCVGYGSFANVVRGMREGLAACGVYEGFVPLDQYMEPGEDRAADIEQSDEDERLYEGFSADIGFLVGNPITGVGLMRSDGQHKRHMFLLPPNSTYVPAKLLSSMVGKVDTLVSPSQWGAMILEEYSNGRFDVMVWQHGVDQEFRATEADIVERMRKREQSDSVKVLHLASTIAERKGTYELLLALPLLMDKVELDVVIPDDAPVKWRRATELAERAGHKVNFLRRVNLGPEHMSRWMRTEYDIVCQPSRGEGFGLVPLEARASGIPCVMTACAGHAEHAPDKRTTCATWVIPHGELGPIDDGEEDDDADVSVAPSIAREDIASTLSASVAWLRNNNRRAIVDTLLRDSYRVRDHWSWPNVTSLFMAEIAGQ